jgi:NADPH:quinone reductase-like Zn-dependent oxidoreductase
MRRKTKEVFMKRLQYGRFGGPEEMYVGEHTLAPLAAHEVRVAVKAAAINPLDWKLRRGEMKIVRGRTFPKGVGSDFAGVIISVGDRVTDFRKGDSVFGTTDIKRASAFAEELIVNTSNIAKIPEGLSFKEAACLPIPFTVAWAAIFDAGKARAGSRLFVCGCNGAVGSAAVQLALTHGMDVSGACSPSGFKSAKAAGVRSVLDYKDVNLFAASGKYDVVFDTIGKLNVRDAQPMLATRGRFVDINPGVSKIAASLFSRRYKLAFATQGLKYLKEIGEMASQGKLRLPIAKEITLDQAGSILTQIEGGEYRPAGKVVVIF